jgi:TM2 domain-containing membrane protein YozV
MIDPELAAKLDEIGAKADRAYIAAEKVRKYLFWTGVITAALIVLPLIGLAFAIPQFISSYTTTLNAIGY